MAADVRPSASRICSSRLGSPRSRASTDRDSEASNGRLGARPGRVGSQAGRPVYGGGHGYRREEVGAERDQVVDPGHGQLTGGRGEDPELLPEV